jgi:hypothetical protein
MVFVGIKGYAGDMKGHSNAYNYQVNSSFEYATNPDIPDFWFQTTVIGGVDSQCTMKGYAEFRDKWHIDTSQAYDGKQSLSMEAPLQLIGSELPLPFQRKEPIIASVYMKATRPETQVQIGLGKRLDSNRGEACVSKDVKVGPSWKRYQVELAERNVDLLYFFVIPKSGGHIWVDAVQIEAGESPGPYAPSPRDEVFKKPFFSKSDPSAPLQAGADQGVKVDEPPLLLSADFNKGTIPQGFEYSAPGGQKDWEVREEALCRMNSKGNGSVSFGQDNWDVGGIEFKFKMLKKYDNKEDSKVYMGYRGAGIRVSFKAPNRVDWIDGDLYKKDKKSGIIIVKMGLEPNKWHTMKVVCENNQPSVYVDGKYVLTGGPFAKERGKVTLGCWMMAAAFDDIKIYAADPKEYDSVYNYQVNSSFENASIPGIPDFWFQTTLIGGGEQWGTAKGYAEFHDKWHIDTSQAYDGKQSLSLEKPLQLIGSELRLPHNEPIIASVYMKATYPETQVQIGFGKRMDSYRDEICVSTDVKVGTSWERYQVKAPGGNPGLLHFFIVPQSQGRIWVDAVQIERGDTATPYVNARLDKVFQRAPVSATEKLIVSFSKNDGIPKGILLDAFVEKSYYTNETEARLVVDSNLYGETVSLFLKIDVISKEGALLVKHMEKLQRASGRMFVNISLEKFSPAGSPYNIKVTATRGEGTQVAVTETALIVLPRAETEVKTNRLNRGIYLNGEPFIPYAVFQGLPDKRENCAAHIEFLKESGMNTLYFPGYWVGRETVDGCVEEAEKRNMQAIVFYDMAPHRNHNAREIFSWLKGKKAIIGIEVADEVGTNPEWVYDAVRDGKKLNPHILFFMNHNVLGLTFFENQPRKTPGDLYSIDYYPISPSLTWIGPSEEIYKLETVMQMLDDASSPKRLPMKYWSQGGWAVYRGLTPVEVEWLNYLPLIYGVRAFVSYIGIPQSKVVWERMGEIGREFETLKPALFSLEDDPNIQPADPVTKAGVKFIAKKHEGKIYVIAVNRLMKKVNALFDLSTVGRDCSGKAEVLFENRKVGIGNGKLEDSFDPLRRHVYVFKCAAK